MNFSGITIPEAYDYPQRAMSCEEWCRGQIEPYLTGYDNTGITLIILIPILYLIAVWLPEDSKWQKFCLDLIPYLSVGYLLIRIY